LIIFFISGVVLMPMYSVFAINFMIHSTNNRFNDKHLLIIYILFYIVN
jgi:hypothetical protein